MRQRLLRLPFAPGIRQRNELDLALAGLLVSRTQHRIPVAFAALSDVSFHLCLPRLDHGFRCMERSRSQFACFITRATLAAVSASS